MATGTVVAAGPNVKDFAVGDTVYYRQNASLRLRESGTALNCRSGTHASVAVLNPSGTHGADLVPREVEPETASLFVMPSVGLYGVDMAGVGVGGSVVVIGLGMTGLGVVSAAVRRGAVVVGIDPRSECRSLASRFGAAATLAPEPDLAFGQMADLVPGISDSNGADFVFELTGRHDCVDMGIRLSSLWLFRLAGKLRGRAGLLRIPGGASPAAFYSDIYHGKAGSVIGSTVNWEAAR